MDRPKFVSLKTNDGKQVFLNVAQVVRLDVSSHEAGGDILTVYTTAGLPIQINDEEEIMAFQAKVLETVTAPTPPATPPTGGLEGGPLGLRGLGL